MSPHDLTEALRRESTQPLPASCSPAARTALQAAHTAYEARFGHAFVICLDGVPTAERLDQVLTGIHDRYDNDPDEERAIAADELRRLARARLLRLAGVP